MSADHARGPVLVMGDIGHRAAFHVGDEAMLQAFVPGGLTATDWIAVSADPALTTELIGVPAVPRAGLAEGSPAPALSAALARARALLVTGGGNLTSTWPEQIAERATLIELAADRGLPVVVTGQTVGPILDEPERTALARALARAGLVGAREAASAQVLARLGVPRARITCQLDDAMFLPGDPSPATPPGPWIAVTVPPLRAGGQERRLLDALGGQLAAIAAATGATVALIPHEGDRGGALALDARTSDDLVRAITRGGGDACALPLMEPPAVAALTRAADMVIAARYHPVVFGLGAGVPCLGVHLDDYTRTKLRGALGFAGLEAWTLPVDAAGGELAAAATDLWERRTEVRAHLESLLPGWRASAARHARRVRALLDGEDDPGGEDVGRSPAGPQPRGSWVRTAALVDDVALRSEHELRVLHGRATELERMFAEAERYALALRAALDAQGGSTPSPPPQQPATIRFSDLRHEQDGDVAIASMLVEGSAQPCGRIELRRHAATLDEIDRSATPFAPLAAVLAVARGADALLDGPVDETARAGAEAGAAQLAEWFAWRAPAVRATSAAPAQAPRPVTALCFSRGLDSMASFVLRRPRLDALIGMSWEDPPYADTGTDAVWRETRAAAAQAGLPLLQVSTNARTQLDPVIPWDFTHGAVLAALAQLLAPGVGEALIAGAFPLGQATPTGTHFDLDHHWSSSRVRIVSDEGGGGRNEKAAIVAGDPFAVRWLSVCWERPGERNCGRCSKCVLTLTNFHIAGGLDAVRERFEAELTPEAIHGVAIDGAPTSPQNARLVLDALPAGDPLRPAWEHMLEVALERDAATVRARLADG